MLNTENSTYPLEMNRPFFQLLASHNLKMKHLTQMKHNATKLNSKHPGKLKVREVTDLEHNSGLQLR